nr:hypothetical protein [Tanacetum cinerariifolium]
MVDILEKSEHNVDFYPIMDFVEASPLRIETTEEGTKILASVDGILRTVTESSLRVKAQAHQLSPITHPPLRRTQIAQSSVLPPAADEPVSLLRDVSQGEACPTDYGFGADQDKANIA